MLEKPRRAIGQAVTRMLHGARAVVRLHSARVLGCCAAWPRLPGRFAQLIHLSAPRAPREPSILGTRSSDFSLKRAGGFAQDSSYRKTHARARNRMLYGELVYSRLLPVIVISAFQRDWRMHSVFPTALSLADPASTQSFQDASACGINPQNQVAQNDPE